MPVLQSGLCRSYLSGRPIPVCPPSRLPHGPATSPPEVAGLGPTSSSTSDASGVRPLPRPARVVGGVGPRLPLPARPPRPPPPRPAPPPPTRGRARSQRTGGRRVGPKGEGRPALFSPRSGSGPGWRRRRYTGGLGLGLGLGLGRPPRAGPGRQGPEARDDGRARKETREFPAEDDRLSHSRRPGSRRGDPDAPRKASSCSPAPTPGPRRRHEAMGERRGGAG